VSATNLYVQTINDVVDHIERSLCEPLTLHSVSRQFYLSEFHFSRLFKMITGISVKQYILGRKLAAAAEKLQSTQNTVTDVALDFGFDYPEVFSRAFKKWFGVAPAVYRNNPCDVMPMARICVVERDIGNFQGGLALKESYSYLEEKDLCGIYIEADENAPDFYETLRSAGERFLTDPQYFGCIRKDYFYTVVNCHGDDSGKYTVFYGGEQAGSTINRELKIRNIPAGWYACFTYRGEMPDMLETFNADFYRWVITKEIELSPNGIGMLNIYDRQDLASVRILIPVKRPK